MMNIKVCIGSSCHLKGSRNIVMEFQKLIKEYNLSETVDLSGSFCMNNCQNGVCVSVDGSIFSLSPDKTESFFKNEILSRVNMT